MSIKASIIILNYNGEKVIRQTIESVLASQCAFSYEIIIVDNASIDKSKQILQKIDHDKKISFLWLEKNFGFAGGNNRGIAKARGEYVILLNNDCPVQKDWLQELITCADAHPDSFSVNSKICLYPHYLKIKLPIVHSRLGNLQKITLEKSNILTFQKERSALNLTWALHQDKKTIVVDVPFDPHKDRSITVCLHANSKLTKVDDFLVSDKLPHYVSSKLDTDISSKNISLNITLNTQSKKQACQVIQNAGTIVFQNGYSRDIGAVLSADDQGHFEVQTYETDHGQYDHVRAVYGTCGAAVLYRRAWLQELGGLDENFFMYYEDTALSEQARLAGYQNYYCPSAVVNHLHALSSGEWSNFFIFHVEKGRLLHVYNNFPARVFRREWREFCARALFRLARAVIKRDRVSSAWQYWRVIGNFVAHHSHYAQVRRDRYATSEQLIEDNFQEILQGRWYFNSQ